LNIWYTLVCQSFSEEAALTVAGCPAEILDVLVDASLLQLHARNRYMMHPTIADYADHQLEQDGEHFEQVSQRFIAYFTRFVEAHCTDYPLLEAERANILAALEAAAVQDESFDLPRLACAFAPFLLARGLVSLAEYHLQRAYDIALFVGDIPGQRQVCAALEEVWQQRDKKE
jgi:hypothetical protein